MGYFCWSKEKEMNKTVVTLPQVSLIAATRVLLGGGLGLLLADRLSGRRRRLAGWTLFLAGAASTIPLARMALGKRCED